MQNEEEQLGPLHDDPAEAMQLENELMKLKMQAEFGALFGNMMENTNLPPEIENQFLQHVYGFEKAYEKTENTTVSQLIDDYKFTPFEQLSKPEQEQAWEKVQAVYSAKNMRIDFCNDYPLEVKYRFATEELPLEETMMTGMPSMTTYFIYEEFHPNHAANIEDRAKDFIEGWFAQNAEKCLH